MHRKRLPPPDPQTVTVYNDCGQPTHKFRVADAESARAVASTFPGRDVRITASADTPK